MPVVCSTRETAAMKAATALFMSFAPRPTSWPSMTCASNGPAVQPSPAGTTSRWPAKPKCGEPDPRIATMFSVGPSGASPSTQRWTVKPIGSSAAWTRSKTSPRAGVMLGQRISSAASATGSIGLAIRRHLASHARLASCGDPRLPTEAYVCYYNSTAGQVIRRLVELRLATDATNVARYKCSTARPGIE